MQGENNIEIIMPEYNDDTLKAAQYLTLQDMGKTMQEIAEYFGLKSRQSVYTWVAKWEASGAMEKARQIVLLPKSEKIKAMNSQILDRWAGIVDGVAKIAENPKAPGSTRLMAAAWIYETIVKPELEGQAAAGATERAYAESDGEFNPSVVKLPANLKRKIGIS